jgi:hypothetical protein
MGRPRLFTDTVRIHVAMDAADYELLKGEMLEVYRLEHPSANFSDFARGVLGQAIDAWRAGEAERNGVAARRRQRMRKLAEAVVGASDAKIERTARKLAALVDEPAA